MCRLFGFRSVIKSQVHKSLISADNALMQQGEEHPDGWGVAYWIADAPNIVRSLNAAVDDNLFKRVSGLVSSETVIAHLRKATTGRLSILNTHPFQHGRWVFAHNGNIKDLHKHLDKLKSCIDPQLRRFILGDTDSEIIFFIVLSRLLAVTDIHAAVGIRDLSGAITAAVDQVVDIVGPCCQDTDGPPTETYLSFLITNGSTIAAHHGGKDLYFSTYKKTCSDRATCPSFGYECENPTKSGLVNHLLFSSEPLQGENIWLPMSYGDIVGTDASMHLWRNPVGEAR